MHHYDRDGALHVVSLGQLGAAVERSAPASEFLRQGPYRRRGGRPRYSLAPLVRLADANRDGWLERAEVRAAVARHDRDGDGRLSGNELRSYRTAVGERRVYVSQHVRDASYVTDAWRGAATAAPTSSFLPVPGSAAVVPRLAVTLLSAPTAPMRPASGGAAWR